MGVTAFGVSLCRGESGAQRVLCERGLKEVWLREKGRWVWLREKGIDVAALAWLRKKASVTSVAEGEGFSD